MKMRYSAQCGKNRYSDEGYAIRNAIASSRRGGLPLRTYRCPDCKGWHLTKRREWHEVPAPVRVPGRGTRTVTAAPAPAGSARGGPTRRRPRWQPPHES